MNFDVIVLGLGAMGSAAAYQLAREGVSVLGIDQFSPPHIYGSTHGDTRITRQAIGEGEQYSPLSLRSYEIFREIENQTGTNLLKVTGGLILSSAKDSAQMHGENFFENTLSAARKFNIKHEVLDSHEIRRRFPLFRIQDDEVGYFEFNMGFLNPEECIRAQLQLASEYGAKLHRNERVLEIRQVKDKVTVRTDFGEYQGNKLIISAGAWIPTFLPDQYRDLFSVTRQVLFWFDISDSFEDYRLGNFPVFIWELKGKQQGIYGFPAVNGRAGGLKVATEQMGETTTADSVEREIQDHEPGEVFHEYVQPFFQGIGPKCIKAISCLYTTTPDFGFVIDRHPEFRSIILASPCSGHGFKHSAAIGESLAQLAIYGKSTIDLSAFSVERFR
ncbi:N-methyl-L-tryptophan oxidase [bacterium]|jgi:sarcosine oxidase|nr:N-methyl-L-tryptophan oxidase [bacterium]